MSCTQTLHTLCAHCVHIMQTAVHTLKGWLYFSTVPGLTSIAKYALL